MPERPCLSSTQPNLAGKTSPVSSATVTFH